MANEKKIIQLWAASEVMSDSGVIGQRDIIITINFLDGPPDGQVPFLVVSHLQVANRCSVGKMADSNLAPRSCKVELRAYPRFKRQN